MNFKRFLLSGGAVFIALLALAAIVTYAYGPSSVTLSPLTRLSSLEDVGASAYRVLPEKTRSHSVLILNQSIAPEAFMPVARGFLRAMREAGIQASVIAPPSIFAGSEIDGDPVVSKIIDRGNLKEFAEALAASLRSDRHTVVFMPSTEGSHRMGINVLTFLEKQLSVSIPAITVGGLALDPNREASLTPACEMSASYVTGETIDLGCLLLRMSRQQQLEHMALDQPWSYIEQVAPNEEILAIYLPQR